MGCIDGSALFCAVKEEVLQPPLVAVIARAKCFLIRFPIVMHRFTPRHSLSRDRFGKGGDDGFNSVGYFAA